MSVLTVVAQGVGWQLPPTLSRFSLDAQGVTASLWLFVIDGGTYEAYIAAGR